MPWRSRMPGFHPPVVRPVLRAGPSAPGESEGIEEATCLTCDAMHVDGGINARVKEEKLAWQQEVPHEALR